MGHSYPSKPTGHLDVITRIVCNFEKFLSALLPSRTGKLLLRTALLGKEENTMSRRCPVNCVTTKETIILNASIFKMLLLATLIHLGDTESSQQIALTALCFMMIGYGALEKCLTALRKHVIQ